MCVFAGKPMRILCVIADLSSLGLTGFVQGAGGRAGQTARPVRPGLAPGNDELTDEPGVPGPASAPQPQSDRQAAHARAFDASEGTPHDPLRNKTYDLNYAKTVPVIQ